jgi:hypothetical protein
MFQEPGVNTFSASYRACEITGTNLLIEALSKEPLGTGGRRVVCRMVVSIPLYLFVVYRYVQKYETVNCR